MANLDLLRFLVTMGGKRQRGPTWNHAVLDDGTITAQEKIAVSMRDFILDFIEIGKAEAHHAETISVSMQNFSIDFIPASEV